MFDDFVAHNLVSTVSEQRPSSVALDAGRALLVQGLSPKGWSTVSPDFDASRFTRVRGKAYVFSRSLPVIVRDGKIQRREYKEWDAAIGADDVLASLDEFRTDCGCLFVPSRVRKGRPPGPSSDGPPSKRRMLDNDSLSDVIPEPHVHLAPKSCLPSTSPPNPKFQPYKKSVPRPIAPHTAFTVQEFLTTPYMRCAWIVPVRGVLPWEGCSPAIVLSRSEDNDALGTGQIVWTRGCLATFWSFLLAVRDAKTIGSIAFAFHASTDSGLVDDGSHRMDYIKVYHDARYTMIVRNVLDAWGYPTGTKKIRVLKEKQLALVDDKARGLLVC